MRGVAERQGRMAEGFRDDYLFVAPRVLGVTSANLFEMMSAPFGGPGLAALNGVVGSQADRWTAEIRGRDGALGGSLDAQRSTAKKIGEQVGWLRRTWQLGSAAITQGGFPSDKLQDITVGYARDKLIKKSTKTATTLIADRYSSASSSDDWLTRALGQFLNFVGKSSYWIGANRSGASFSYDWQRDALGRLPLGDTRVGVTGKTGPNDRNVRWDQAAKWHDVQDYVNWHAPAGTEVKVPWGQGKDRYFISRGAQSKDHDREVARLVLNQRMEFPMTDRPTTAMPQDLSAIQARYPVPGVVQAKGATSVGGVYLGGSGQALGGVGLLQGIALDANGNLVLLDKGGNRVDLPPLRLDDVVTIFRSVYLYGETPTVSIDPNPDDPEGSAMSIRHGPVTAETYVGWVLFQADRLMKTYTLGVDNTTAKKIKTGVAGYSSVLDRLYFGGAMRQKGQQGGHWERFWIVPAETTRLGDDRRALTLLDVSLKVKTQSMKWANGRLVNNAAGQSSPGATAFTHWFTEHYDDIAAERFLVPPTASGLTRPVPVFAELRRIALITAIAEQLRDQGVPLPFWMRDYPVTPVPFERSTPALEIKRYQGQVMARIFGGVNLAADDRSVRRFAPGSDLSTLHTEEEREAVRAGLALASRLEDSVREEMRQAEPLEVKQLTHAEGGVQAVALPGAQTQALAPVRLEEADLAVPIAQDVTLTLERRYNSFFDPSGPWGKGWALDLPRLVETRVPVRRTGDAMSFQAAYELITPHNAIYVRFSRIVPVPDLGNAHLFVPDAPAAGTVADVYGLANAQPDFLSGPTRQLIRKNGEVWHFDRSGSLVATEANGVRVVYEHDAQGRLTRISGLLGRQPVAFIDLTYNAAGLLTSATARSNQADTPTTMVRYGYDGSGRLEWVESGEGRLGYRYQGPWLTAVTFGSKTGTTGAAQDQVLRRFEYDGRGRLLREFAADGTATDYHVVADPKGYRLVANTGSDAATESLQYDDTLRPVEARFADGTGATWRYPAAGGTILDLRDPDGAVAVQMTESADRRQRTLAAAEGPQLSSTHDAAGHLTALEENGRTVLKQAWAADGRLRQVTTESQAEHYEYDADGLVSRVIETPPDATERFERWRATRLDPFGRPVEVTDDSGLRLSLSYDPAGGIEAVSQSYGDQTMGLTVARDDRGRVVRIATDSIVQKYRYSDEGLLDAVTTERDGTSAGAEWEDGLLKRVKRFDGGEVVYNYYDDTDRVGLLRRVTGPNGLALHYEYTDDHALNGVTVANQMHLGLTYDGSGRLTGWKYRSTHSRRSGETVRE